jgi:hypothetical protein
LADRKAFERGREAILSSNNHSQLAIGGFLRNFRASGEHRRLTNQNLPESRVSIADRFMPKDEKGSISACSEFTATAERCGASFAAVFTCWAGLSLLARWKELEAWRSCSV